MDDDIPITLDRDGRKESLHGLRSPGEVAAAVMALKGERDVTLTVRPRNFNDYLLVTVDGELAFIGVFDPSDWASEFHRHDFLEGPKVEMMIGGQTTDIDPANLLDVPMAARVIAEWLAGSEPSDGRWVRT
jgi:hypothetical protein